MKKNILAIIGSASENSSNLKLVENLADLMQDDLTLSIYQDLKTLPHFNPELAVENTPQIILAFRELINKAEGVIICTPEYIFSIPSGLKNAIEWCVATTVFAEKPLGLITASAQGEKGHEELKLIMKTVMANFTEDTTLLIQGIKVKIDLQGKIIDKKTEEALNTFVFNYKKLIQNQN